MKRTMASLVMALFLGAIRPASAQIYADTVLYNGKILTADSDNAANFTIAQAVAVYDGKIRAVGRSDEILKFSGPGTQKIDLKGKTVIPGIIDTHRHVSPRGATSGAGRADSPIKWTTKDEGLAQLRTIALGKKPGEWITMGTLEGFGTPLPILRMEVTRADLDQVTPNNPVYINWGATNNALVNTVSLNMLLKHYPGGIAGMYKDDRGNYTGYLEGVGANTFKTEFEPRAPVEIAAPLHKERLERTAADGVTTVSTWVNPYSISVYSWLDRRGEMPVRVAFSHEGFNDSPDPDMLLRRMGDLVGHGTDHLWMVGIAAVNVDGTVPSGWACIYKEYPREHPNFPEWLNQPWGPHGRCYLTDPRYSDRELLLAANRYGMRVTGTHVGGDRAVDEYLDVLEVADKESPVAAKRFGMDHCRFISEEQAQRAAKFGVVFNCKPDYIYGGDKGEVGAIGVIYGNEVAADLVVPARRMIDAGLKPATEIAGNTFRVLETLVTRKDKDGKVWGPQQRIDRREALLTFTRWPARYVLKEDRIGSIEPGKWADLLVLDKDFLTVPEEEISELKVLMTLLGGKPTYTAANFAQAEGLPLVGYQGPTSTREMSPGERIE